MLKNRFVAVTIAAAVAVGSLTAGVSMASAATPPKHVKLLTCKAPLEPTRIKETVKGKTVHVWKCEAAKPVSAVKKPAPKKPTAS
jgi:hypothetical protein